MLLETRADINFCNPVTAVAAATADMQAFASLFGWHVEARVTDLCNFAVTRPTGLVRRWSAPPSLRCMCRPGTWPFV